MKIFKTNVILFAWIFIVANWGCSVQTEQSVYIDSAFTKLFLPDRGAVTGADGTISILLDDGTSLFMTGDCFLGEVVDGKRDKSTKMINNAFIHISADSKYIASYYNGTYDDPKSLCAPLEADTSKVAFWYWPGHGFQQGDILHIFMTKFYQGGEGQWGFRFGGTDYLRLKMSDYSVISTEEVFSNESAVHWGHSVIKDDGYVYVYGSKNINFPLGNSALCVSRVPIDKGKNRIGSFEFYNGSGWSSNEEEAIILNGINASVSEQFSVFKHEDTYVLFTQQRGQQAADIFSYISDTPYGPWRNEKLIYTTLEQDLDKNLFTYNAMAHPQYINEKDELLACYNINSYNVSDIFEDVQAYRPVFFRVPMGMVLE